MNNIFDLSICKHNREAYGKTLIELGNENENIVVLDADLSGSTKTIMFAERFPRRFINVGIAEQNLMGIAAGLARCGKIPFVSTYAMFGCGRAWEQIRNAIALDNLNVNIVMTHGGLSLGADGATHQMFEDIALMRVIPNMRVIIPADVNETRAVLKFVAKEDGPSYIRLSRRSSPVIFDETYIFNPNDYPVLVDGSDVTIFSTGGMICNTLKACEQLIKAGISTKLVNVHNIKPLANESILKAAKETGIVVTVEDHNIKGGLGSAIAELLIEKYPVRMKMIGINDEFGGSGKVDELNARYGLSVEQIVKSVKEFLKSRELTG
ncbi:MAG: transketolase family protein [Candidatus Methanoperedens sp.]